MYNNSKIVKFSEVVDMALGSTEQGSANFNLLNAVLKTLARELKLNNRRVHVATSINSSCALPGSSLLNPRLTGPRAGNSSTSSKSDYIETNWKIVVPRSTTNQTTANTRNFKSIDERCLKLETNIKDIQDKILDVKKLLHQLYTQNTKRPLKNMANDAGNAMTSTIRKLRKSIDKDVVESKISKLSVKTNSISIKGVSKTACSPSTGIKAGNSRIGDSHDPMLAVKAQEINKSEVQVGRPCIIHAILERLEIIEKTLEKDTTECKQPNEQGTEAAKSEHLHNLVKQVETQGQMLVNLEQSTKDARKQIKKLTGIKKQHADVKQMQNLIDNIAEKQENFTKSFREQFDKYKLGILAMQDYIIELHKQLNGRIEITPPTRKEIDIRRISNNVNQLDENLDSLSFLLNKLISQSDEEMTEHVCTAEEYTDKSSADDKYRSTPYPDQRQNPSLITIIEESDISSEGEILIRPSTSGLKRSKVISTKIPKKIGIYVNTSRPLAQLTEVPPRPQARRMAKRLTHKLN